MQGRYADRPSVTLGLLSYGLMALLHIAGITLGRMKEGVNITNSFISENGQPAYALPAYILFTAKILVCRI